MSLSGLNKESQRIAKALFAAWPDWEAFAENENGFLSVTIPDPVGSDLYKPLQLWVEEEEVTVGLDWYHAHFDLPPYQSGLAPELLDSVALVRLFVEEHHAVISYFQGERWCGSTMILADDVKVRSLREEDVMSGSGSVGNPLVNRIAADRVRVRSWRGTLDLDRSLRS